MIVSASYRTDIPALYGDWFARRRAAGWCLVANPYGGRPSRVPLVGPEVDGFVFWTRHPEPFIPQAEEMAAAGVPMLFQVTVTGYPRALEPSVIEPERAIAGMRRLAALLGPAAVVWRYDPVLLTDLTPPDWHRRQVAALAGALRGTAEEVVLSFAQIYRKTARRLAAAADLAWSDPPAAEKRALLGDLADLARAAGLRPSLCSQPDLVGPALPPARCIDGERLQALAGKSFRYRIKGNRPGCLCAESRDIGAYDSCVQGCLYCYAVADPQRAVRHRRAHRPDGEALLPLPGTP